MKWWTRLLHNLYGTRDHNNLTFWPCRTSSGVYLGRRMAHVFERRKDNWIPPPHIHTHTCTHTCTHFTYQTSGYIISVSLTLMTCTKLARLLRPWMLTSLWEQENNRKWRRERDPIDMYIVYTCICIHVHVHVHDTSNKARQHNTTNWDGSLFLFFKNVNCPRWDLNPRHCTL